MAVVSGDVALMSLGDLVLWLASRQVTAELLVRRRGVESTFVIRGGMCTRASSSDPREYLGQHLINFGHISEHQLQRAFDTQRETHVPLGRVLIMVEAVTAEQLERVLTFKTREGLLEALSWDEGTWRITDVVESATELDCVTPVDLPEAHSEATARRLMWAEIRRVFPSDATRVDVPGDPRSLDNTFDRRLLGFMQAGCSVGEAALELRAMDFQTYARLYDFYQRGMVQPRVTTHAVSGARLQRAEAAYREARVPTPAAGGGLLDPSSLGLHAPVDSAQPQPELAPLDPGFLGVSLFAFPTPAGAFDGPPASPPVPPRDELSGPTVVVGSPMETSAAGASAAGAPAASGSGLDSTPPFDIPRTGPPESAAFGAGMYTMVKPEPAAEQPGVAIPPEAEDPERALRLALAGRNWSEGLLLAQRILELDPLNSEAIAAYRVAEAQLRRAEKEAPQDLDLARVPLLVVPREQVAQAHLTSKERYVLSRVDGKRSLQQIAAVSPIQQQELVRIVDNFVTGGVVRFA